MAILISNNLQYNFHIISTLLIGFLLFILIKVTNKKPMHYIFICFVTLLIIWNLGVILDKMWSDIFGYTNMIFVDITFIGTFFIPVLLFLTGLIFAKTKIKLTFRYLLLFVIPVVSMIILWTNEYHHLFFIKYSFISNDVIYGKYFIIHAIYSYTCILLGMYYLIYFSIRNTGVFSKQSILILVGTIIPLMVNIIFTLKIFVITQFATPITFSFATYMLFYCYNKI